MRLCEFMLLYGLKGFMGNFVYVVNLVGMELCVGLGMEDKGK